VGHRVSSSRVVAAPRLLQVGPGSLREVAALLCDHRFDLRRVLVASGPGPSRALARLVAADLRAHGVEVMQRSGLCGRMDQAVALASELVEGGVTTAVAVGGGRVIDPVKLAAARAGIEFVSVPTTISNDGICSPVASLVGAGAVRESHAARMPCGVVVDIEAVGSSPARTVRAGVADLVSNLTACLDWRLADRLGHDRFDAYSAQMAEAAVRPVLVLASLTSASSHEVLAHGLVLSGLAMGAAGTSRPCSGAEHLVSHALDAQLGPRAALHGEQVALGCLVSAAAHGSPLLAELRRFFGRLGLPLSPEELGIERQDLIDAVASGPSLRPGRWTILSERVRGRADAAELVDDAFATAGPAVELAH